MSHVALHRLEHAATWAANQPPERATIARRRLERALALADQVDVLGEEPSPEVVASVEAARDQVEQLRAQEV